MSIFIVRRTPLGLPTSRRLVFVVAVLVPQPYWCGVHDVGFAFELCRALSKPSSRRFGDHSAG